MISHTENGTIKSGLNVSFNELNATTIRGDMPDAFLNTNFTARYDLRNDRFGLANYTTLEDSAFRMENYTSLENSAFKVGNYTALEDSAFRNANFTGQYGVEYASTGFKLGNLTSGGGSGSTGKAVCWKTTTTLGFCSDAPAGDGACTCN